MAKRPEDLTIDYRQLLRMTVSDRVSFAQSSQGESYLASLTPIQLARLFPEYYRNQINIGGGGGSITSGGTRRTAPSGTAMPVSTRRTSPAPSNYPATPAPSPNLRPSWYDKFMGNSQPSQTPDTIIDDSELGAVKPGASKNRLDIPYIQNGKKVPASVRYNNPGASWPRARDELFGLEGYGHLKDGLNSGKGNYIGKYPTVIHGLASNMDLMATSDNYRGKTLKQATYTWRGKSPGNVPSGKLSNGFEYGPNTVLTPELLRNKEFMTAVFGHYAKHEAGRNGTITSEHLSKAYDIYMAGGIESYKAQRRTLPETPPKEATDVKKQDPSKTGVLMPQAGLREIPQDQRPLAMDPRTLNELNLKRPGYFKGVLQLEGETYEFGTGGRNRGSMPYGEFVIKPGLHQKSRYKSFENNSFYVNDMFDPKAGDFRQGMLIHKASDWDKLYSSGCLAIRKDQWEKFKAHMTDYQKRIGGPITVSVRPDGTATIAPQGMAGAKPVDTVLKGREELPQNVDPGLAAANAKRLPDGLPQPVVDYFKTLTVNEQEAFIRKIESEGTKAVGLLSELYQSDNAKNQAEVAKNAEAVVQAVTETPAGQLAAPDPMQQPGEVPQYKSEVALGRALKKMGLRVSEHPEFGGTDYSAHKGAGHKEDRALDINIGRGVVEAEDPVTRGIFDKVSTWAQTKGYKSIWKTKGHYNHIHFEAERGAQPRPDFSDADIAGLVRQFNKDELAYFKDNMGQDLSTFLRSDNITQATAVPVKDATETGRATVEAPRAIPTAAPAANLTIERFPTPDDPFKGVEFPEGMPKPNVNALSPEYRRWAALQDRATLSQQFSEGWNKASGLQKAFASPDAVAAKTMERFNAARDSMSAEERDATMKQLEEKRAAEIATAQAQAEKTAQTPEQRPAVQTPEYSEPVPMMEAAKAQVPKMQQGGSFQTTDNLAVVDTGNGKVKAMVNEAELKTGNIRKNPSTGQVEVNPPHRTNPNDLVSNQQNMNAGMNQYADTQTSALSTPTNVGAMSSMPVSYQIGNPDHQAMMAAIRDMIPSSEVAVDVGKRANPYSDFRQLGTRYNRT